MPRRADLFMHEDVQTHYDAFLAGCYSWISGSTQGQVRKNRDFFSSHGITPDDNTAAIDLGAGCGFQSVPLAGLGYSVTAVDFCGLLLDELRSHAGDLPILTIQSDILHFSSWSGRHPALIVCMGDTLTHLPALADVEDLIRQCFSELAPGGRLILTLRDYSREPEGTIEVIPVLRESDGIFLCRLEFHTTTLTVHDILYSRIQGMWERTAGKYTKIRIAPELLNRMLAGAGFAIVFSAAENGMMTVIARKGR
jgi:SAM-dependent methyltransferase